MERVKQLARKSTGVRHYAVVPDVCILHKASRKGTPRRLFAGAPHHQALMQRAAPAAPVRRRQAPGTVALRCAPVPVRHCAGMSVLCMTVLQRAGLWTCALLSAPAPATPSRCKLETRSLNHCMIMMLVCRVLTDMS